MKNKNSENISRLYLYDEGYNCICIATKGYSLLSSHLLFQAKAMRLFVSNIIHNELESSARFFLFSGHLISNILMDIQRI